ncbi:MAG TPA: hypothetical protein VFW29_04175, partial [Solirubrobacteraceae bacterium]|nr:hypothetical protein [Solirubrobacteraceae bacterium]
RVASAALSRRRGATEPGATVKALTVTGTGAGLSLVMLLQRRVRIPEPALIASAAVVGLVAFG